jgi:hypothetical protein
MREWKANEFPRFKDMIMNPYKKGNKQKFNAYKKYIFNRVKGVMNEQSSLIKSKIHCIFCLTEFCIPGFNGEDENEDAPYNRFLKNTGLLCPYDYAHEWSHHEEMTCSEFKKLLLKTFKDILDSLSPTDFQYLITQQFRYNHQPSNLYKDFEFGYSVRIQENYWMSEDIKFDY